MNSQQQKIIKKISENLRQSDYLNIGFLKPFQVTLRTNQTDSNITNNFLPQGLMQVIKKKTIFDNKYDLAPFQPINHDVATLEQLKAGHMNNYISLLKAEMIPNSKARQYSDHEDNIESTRETKKSLENRMELGICVTLRGQDRKTFKRTMTGVAQNIYKILKGQKIHSDNIFVVVMVDGMTNVDKSLYQYFKELEKHSRTFLEDKDYKVLEQLRRLQDKYDQKIYKTNYLFTPEQIAQRLKCRPEQVIQNYKKMSNNKQYIKSILVKNQVKKILQEEYQNFDVKHNKDIEIQHSALLNHIGERERFCQQYINSRESLAYVVAYKVNIGLFSQDVRINLEQEKEKQRLNLQGLIEGVLTRSHKKNIEQMLEDLDSQENDDILKYMNLFFCIKYEQSGTLSSHNWFLNGFCQELKPKYTVIMETGILPGQESIYRMYRCMRSNPDVGGVCGYIKVVKEDGYEANYYGDLNFLSKFSLKLFEIRRAKQMFNHFQYLTKKPFEAMCGYMLNLPAAFSAYNMDVLLPEGVNDNQKLLGEYFKQINDKINKKIIIPTEFTVKQIILRLFLPKFIRGISDKLDQDSEERILYNSNVYQAQNPIMCLGIYKNSKIIAFLPDVEAEVQPVRMLNDIMHQQKKVINGQIFSSKQAKRQLTSIDKSTLKFSLKFQFAYINIAKSLSYFMLAIFMFLLEVSFTILNKQMYDSLHGQANFINADTFQFVRGICLCFYLMIIGGITVISLYLNHQSKQFKIFTYFASTVLGIFALFSFSMMFLQAVEIFKGNNQYQKYREDQIHENEYYTDFMELIMKIYKWAVLADIFILLAPFVVYSIAYKKFDRIRSLFTNIFSLAFYLPTFSIMFSIYSKSRLDEISSKIKLTKNSMKMLQSWKVIKMINLGKYLIWNFIIFLVLISISEASKFLFFIVILVTIGAYNIVRVISAIVYLIKYRLKYSSSTTLIISESQNQTGRPRIIEFKIYSKLDELKKNFRNLIRKNLHVLLKEHLIFQNDASFIRQFQEQAEAESL